MGFTVTRGLVEWQGLTLRVSRMAWSLRMLMRGPWPVDHLDRSVLQEGSKGPLPEGLYMCVHAQMRTARVCDTCKSGNACKSPASPVSVGICTAHQLCPPFCSTVNQSHLRRVNLDGTSLHVLYVSSVCLLHALCVPFRCPPSACSMPLTRALRSLWLASTCHPLPSICHLWTCSGQ